jgi:hypothetical protein
VTGEVLVETIDLEKDHVAVDFGRSKMVFFTWVVSMATIVVRRDRLDDPGDGFGPEGGDASGCDGQAHPQKSHSGYYGAFSQLEFPRSVLRRNTPRLNTDN